MVELWPPPGHNYSEKLGLQNLFCCKERHNHGVDFKSLISAYSAQPLETHGLLRTLTNMLHKQKKVLLFSFTSSNVRVGFFFHINFTEIDVVRDMK